MYNKIGDRMKRLSSTLLNITTIICFIVSFIYYMIFLNSGLFNYGHYTADIIYPYFFVLTTPCLNLFRYTKKIKTSTFYNIITSFIFIIITYYTLDALIIFYKLKYLNIDTFYFFPKEFLFVILLFTINYIMNIFCKYEVKESKHDKTVLLLIIMLFTTILALSLDYILKPESINRIMQIDFALLIESILIALILVKRSTINSFHDLDILYAILFVINVLTFNPFGVIFSIQLYKYIDKYGTFL